MPRTTKRDSSDQTASRHGVALQPVVRAHWEHGYRCHGLWLDDRPKRLGCVGLGPRGLWDGLYRWYIDATREEGTTRTLRSAKKAVEQRVL
jgi:hypothetical protein